MSVKDFQLAGAKGHVAHTGSKKKLLKRLVAFKANFEKQDAPRGGDPSLWDDGTFPVWQSRSCAM